MTKEEYNLSELLNQEQNLIFDKFTNPMAMKIGLLLLENARKMNKSISIDIKKGGQQIFHYSMEGTTLDNDLWIERKVKVVNRFFKSSLYVGTKLKLEGKTIEEKYLISSQEYAAYGGAFPINIKDVGFVGTIAVSGMRQIEDHNIIIETLSKYLNK